MFISSDATDELCGDVDDGLKSSNFTLRQSNESCIAVVDVRENEGLDQLARSFTWE